MAALTLAGMATTISHDPLTGFGMKGKGPALPPSGFGGGGGPSGSRPGGPPGGAHQVEEEEACQEAEEPSLP